MKIFKDQDAWHTLSCLNCKKRAKSWLGHIHSNETKRQALAGWCSKECRSKMYVSKTDYCGTGCYGSTRIRTK